MTTMPLRYETAITDIPPDLMAPLQARHTPPKSARRISLGISGTTVPDCSCELVGIDAGILYVRSERQIPESSPITVLFERVQLSGIVAGCQSAHEEGDDEWLISVALGSCRRRLEERVPYGEAGAIGIVESDGTTLRPCTITETSSSGLGLRLSSPIETGARVYVEAESMIVFGEVRHCRPTLDGHHAAGILIVDVVPDFRTQNMFSLMLNNLRWKLASSIRGRNVPAYWADHPCF